MKRFLVLISMLLLALSCWSQSNPGPLNQGFRAGYKILKATDSFRIYKKDTPPSHPLHFRPIEVDVWYPSTSQNEPVPPLKYGEFVQLLQERSNRFQDDTLYKDMTSQLLRYISLQLNIPDPQQLANLKTASYGNLPPAEGRFPLIIYQCAFNGMSYENIPLFERLAKKGFVVACIPSVGRYPGNMSTHLEDLREQTEDGLFALRLLGAQTNIDTSRIGTLGYSWGGLAGLLMAMEQKRIKALFSLDGSEMFYYRGNPTESHDFDQIRKLPAFKPESLHIPYAYMESGQKQSEDPADSIYNVCGLFRSERTYVHFKEAIHEDFSSIPSLSLSKEHSTLPTNGFYDTLMDCVVNFFRQYLISEDQSFTKTVKTLIQNHQADTEYPLPKAAETNARLLSGKIMDATSRQPIAYVNLGIPARNRGTVSKSDGSFQLNVGIADTIEISMIGYETQKYLPKDSIKGNAPCLIFMHPKARALEEVIVSSKFSPSRTLGNTTTSHFFNIGLPLKFLGSEIGIVIKPGKKPMLLQSFNFNVSENHLDSAVFRLNLYSLKGRQPFLNILSENILLRVGSKAGPYHLDLRAYKIILREDVLISLEWIDGGKSGNDRGVLFLSAGLFNAGTWHRSTSLGKWTKANGLGVGFNVSAQTYNEANIVPAQ